MPEEWLESSTMERQMMLPGSWSARRAPFATSRDSILVQASKGQTATAAMQLAATLSAFRIRVNGHPGYIFLKSNQVSNRP